MDQPIRVVLVGLSPLLADIVREIIANQPDITVRGVFDRPEDARVGARDVSADVFVLGGGAKPPSASQYKHLLATERRRAIGISADGRQMSVCELGPVSTLGALSAGELLQLIRGANPLTL